MKLLLTCRADKPWRFLFYTAFATGLFLLTSFTGTVLSAQGNLLITPRRVLFEGSKRSMDLNLANTGKDTAIFAISLIQIRMKEDGNFENISEPDPGQRFADKYIRFFPRTVSLGPGESQVVKIQLIRTNELTEGEYRSHFYFRAVPKANPLGENVVRDTTTITVFLKPVFGISIPVIIRSGKTSVSVKISDMALSYVNDTIPKLSMNFTRSGNISVYGDLTVDYISPAGKVTRVGTANGIAVYTPNLSRKLAMNLVNIKSSDLKSGKLIVTFSAASDAKPAKYAEAELQLH